MFEIKVPQAFRTQTSRLIKNNPNLICENGGYSDSSTSYMFIVESDMTRPEVEATIDELGCWREVNEYLEAMVFLYEDVSKLSESEIAVKAMKQLSPRELELIRNNQTDVSIETDDIATIVEFFVNV